MAQQRTTPQHKAQYTNHHIRRIVLRYSGGPNLSKFVSYVHAFIFKFQIQVSDSVICFQQFPTLMHPKVD